MATTTPKLNWLERTAMSIAPRWSLKRLRARMSADLLVRHYEGASVSRRTQGWRRSSADANQASGPYLARLRDVARDLVRNNPYAESALSTIVDHAVGWGITAKPVPANKRLLDLWNAWANTTACDADGRHDLAGLQKLVIRTMAESGEVLVRRRLRRPEDGLPLPLQLQVLEPDFLDSTKDTLSGLLGAARIIQGVQFDAIGRRTGYWLFPEHPGSALNLASSSFVSADNVLHLFKPQRPGQVRGVTWFAPVMLRFKDFDEFEDATLMKQKIAACLTVITTDPDGSATPLGQEDATTNPPIDSLEPGAILNLQPGRTVDIVEPPAVREYADYSKTMLRAIATGLGVPYEDLTGDYGEMPFSASRMSRLRHWDHVEDWRWRLLVPQFCDPVWSWFLQVANVFGIAGDSRAYWTAPPAPMIDPVNEGLAYTRNIRAGLQSYSEALRERGYDPDEVMGELANDFKALDRLGLVLDIDGRQMTQAGQLQGEAAAAAKSTSAPLAAAAAASRDELETRARRLRLASGERQ